MSQAKEQIAPPVRQSGPSYFSMIVTPLNVTVLGILALLLPLVEHQIATVFYYILRPLTIPLAVIVAAVAVSLVSILTGLLIGLRVRYLAVGPLQVQTGGQGGWSIGLNRAWRRYIGSVLLVPARGSFTRTQGIVSSAVGLLTSLVVFLVTTIYAWSYGWPGVSDPELSTQFETMLQAGPLGAAIVVMAEVLTSGTIVSSILRSSPEQAHRMLVNLSIGAHMATGQRPREWDPELVEQSISVPDSTADHLIGLCFAYLAAVDHGDYAMANQHLRSFEQWLQRSSASVRPYVLSSLTGYASLYHERAWLTAAHRQDLDAASEYLNRATGFTVATTIDLRVKAEILALEGDTVAARSTAEAGLDALDEFPVMERWRIPFERDLLQAVLERTGA